MNAAEILQELVAIPTPSTVSNIPLLHWVAESLSRHGWSAEFLPYEDEAGVAKANLIAWPGTAKLAEFFDLAFLCHTDTVPYAANWTGALTLQQLGDALHGCGSCDVKGALACFLAAVATLDSGTIRRDVALILTADEEIGCKGMERLLNSTKLRIGSAIVSEPTSLRAGIAGKGYGLARINVEGREAHSAFPQQGVSAISAAVRLISRIEAKFSAQVNDFKSDVLFDPPRTTLNIGIIDGGTAKNIVPGRCSFLVEWRAIPGEPPSAVVESLRELAAAETHVGLSIQVDALRAEPGFSPAEQGPLQLRLAEALGGDPIGISFGSEASRLARIADEVIVIGPGDMRTAHSDRECVPVPELERWTAVLASLMRA